MSINIISGTRSLAQTLRQEHRIIAVDIGFASNTKSTGLVTSVNGTITAQHISFGAISESIAVQARQGDLFLILEVPLTMAFNLQGNPIGRTIEKQQGQTRYWYTGSGASVLLAAVLLLEQIRDIRIPTQSTVYLYEGFVTFKSKHTSSRRCSSSTSYITKQGNRTYC